MKKYFNNLIYIILILYIYLFFSSSTLASEINITSKPEVNTSDLNINSDCILLVEKETGDILYEKNSNVKMYPASTTKILTAIIVLEKAYLNELVTVSNSAVQAVPPSYTTANLIAGEKFSVRELLYAMLIPSGNDAANVLAEHISGSIPAFANEMNITARAIGLENSNFTNPSGIHDENLYTTAHDLSLLARYAMNNKQFREIVKTESFTLPSTAIHPETNRTFHNSNLLLDSNNDNYYYKYTTGIKTGFTDPAGDCLVASAKKDDVEFIIVCLKSGNLDNGLREKFLDCKTLFEFAFDNYTTYYKNLQEGNLQENKFENDIGSITSNTQNSTIETTLHSFNILRALSKIVAIIIIILAFKYLFFKKKKKF